MIGYCLSGGGEGLRDRAESDFAQHDWSKSFDQ